MNASKGKAAVLKYDRYNNLIQELVSSGKNIQITREEREINQERAASSVLDLFANGIMVPIRLVDPEDEKEFAENPNLMTDDDLRVMFAMQWREFDAKLVTISNAYTLNRLLDISKDETVKASVRQATQIENRLKSITPELKRLSSFADDR